MVDHPQERAWRQGEARHARADGHDQRSPRPAGGHDPVLWTRTGGGRDPVGRALGARGRRRCRRIGPRTSCGSLGGCDELPGVLALFEAGRLTRTRWCGSLGGYRPTATRRGPQGAGDADQPARADAGDPARRWPTPMPKPDGRARAAPARRAHRGEGWLNGEFCLPPDEGAGGARPACRPPRDAEFRDRQGLEPDAELDDVPEHVRRPVTGADAFVRMASEAADALDPTLAAHRLPRRAQQGRPPPRRRRRRHARARASSTSAPWCPTGRALPRRATPR